MYTAEEVARGRGTLPALLNFNLYALDDAPFNEELVKLGAHSL